MLQEMHPLVAATSIIASADDHLMEFKFSPEMFSIIIDTAPNTPRCFISLQFFPPFFNQYSCDRLQHSWIYMDSFYPALANSTRNGFTSLHFSSQNQDRVDLKFKDPKGN